MNPETTTLVIKHGVTTTPEFLLGQPTGFPDGQPLSPLVIRQGIAALYARQVGKFEDGRFHGDISRLGLFDLVARMSVAEAIAEDFHSLPAKKGLVVQHLGIRWSVSDTIHEARIYGPKSDPSNVLLIDLTGALS